MKLSPRNLRMLWTGGALIALLGGGRTCWATGPTYHWEELAHVKRIAVVPPFFCTEAAYKPGDEKERAYQDGLQKLNATMQKALPNFLAEQPDRFRVAPPPLTERALKALHWQPCDLFVNGGKLADGRWPVPDPERIATLAKRLRVDAIVVGSMRDPASIGHGLRIHHNPWSLNPLNWGFQRITPHVLSPRVQAFLITDGGTIAWKDEQMADHPRTSHPNARNLLVDWEEATEQVAQQLADSLLRLPPPGKEFGGAQSARRP